MYHYNFTTYKSGNGEEETRTAKKQLEYMQQGGQDGEAKNTVEGNRDYMSFSYFSQLKKKLLHARSTLTTVNDVSGECCSAGSGRLNSNV